MTSVPRLSIIIPNYNHANYLEEAVESVMVSTYQDFEVIVIDDASTDDSKNVIEKLMKQYPKLRFIQNIQNLGAVKTMNKGAEVAYGEYYHVLAADDRRCPNFMENSMTLLEANPHIPMCCSDPVFFSEGVPEQKRQNHLIKTDRPFHVFTPSSLPSIFRNSHFWIASHTSIVKRETFLRYGGLLQKLALFCDWYHYHKIALFEGVIYIPRGLAELRVVPSSYSLSFDAKHQREINRHLFQLLEKDSETGRLFRKARILNSKVKSLFFEFLIKPKYWKYLFPACLQALKNRLSGF